MDNQTICTWLGLPPGQWPPDHYRLLDLEQGETDFARIEQQVHQRLEMVRRYQLLYPELVTEAMNRLAQAYICLTDPEARRTYEAGRQQSLRAQDEVSSPSEPISTLGSAASFPLKPLPPLPAEPPSQDPPTGPAGSVASAPGENPSLAETVPVIPPLDRSQVEMPVEIPIQESPLEATGERISPAPTKEARRNGGPGWPVALSGEILDVSEVAEKIDPAVEAARSYGEAHRGTGTKRSLYRRLAATRRLQRAWEEAGKYLGAPQRRLGKPSEATELIQQLQAIRIGLENVPPLLGNAGQAGYAVVALARQATPVPIFQILYPSQRETLAQHWKSGLVLLRTYRDYLRQEIQALRQQNWFGRSIRQVRTLLAGQSVTVLLLLMALLALGVALFNNSK